MPSQTSQAEAQAEAEQASLAGLQTSSHQTPKRSDALVNSAISNGNINPYTKTIDFLKSTNIKFVRLQWVDYINMVRIRILPVSQVFKALEKGKDSELKVTAAVFSVIQNNTATKKAKHGGVRLVHPSWNSLRPLWPNGRPTKQDPDVVVHGAVMCDLRIDEKTEWEVDLRSLLRRKLQTLKDDYGVSLQLGFEIEVVFLPWDKTTGRVSKETRSWGSRQATHSWSSATALLSQNKADIPVSRCMEEISMQLEESGIEILVLHPEATYGQFEFVLGVAEALEAVDKLYHARQIIEIVANQYGYRATLHPKPLEDETGTGAHVHFSLFSAPSVGNSASTMTSDDTTKKEELEHIRKLDGYFAEGLLEHLQAFSALCMPTLASYSRFAAGRLNWSSSQWVCWGSDNKDAPLRMVEAGQPNQHWEFRCADGTANAYLLTAGMVAAGLLGLKAQRPLREPVNGNPDKLSTEEFEKSGLTKKLAPTLKDSFDLLEADREFCEELGRLVVEQFLDVKEAEVATMNAMKEANEDVWGWEVEHY